MKRTSLYILFTLLLLAASQVVVRAQQQVIINMAMLDGVDITPANVFNFQVVNNGTQAREAEITGTLRYRNSSLRMSYTVSRRIQPGNTLFSKDNIGSPVWNFSDNALKELFFNYSKLPEGTYEYCVSMKLKGLGGESIADQPEECLYNRSEDIFLINLLEPDNNAKLYERYPMFNWVVNYPFASELTYRIRIAEQKQGQNPQTAITRNNPIFQDNRVMSTSMVYPVTAKPLETWQPYVWTVDAYYKGILLGGAETWRFMIVEDSVLMSSIPKDISYLDLINEKNSGMTYALGKLKLKYNLSELKTDSLHFVLLQEDKEIKLDKPAMQISKGDNLFELDFSEHPRLRHLKIYNLVIKDGLGATYNVLFRYINTDFL